MHNLEVSSPGSIPRKDADLELRNTVNQRSMKKSSLLLELSPFLNKNGILRVGGCIHEVELPFKVMHPIIFPTRYIITNLIIDHFHHVLHHARCNSALNEVRSNGFCVINGNSLVRFVISKCVKCRILRGKTCATNGRFSKETTWTITTIYILLSGYIWTIYYSRLTLRPQVLCYHIHLSHQSSAALRMSLIYWYRFVFSASQTIHWSQGSSSNH